MKRINRAMFPGILVFGAVTIVLFGAWTTARAQSQQKAPFKLVVSVPQKVHWVGTSTQVRVEVRDTADKRVSATKTTDVLVTLKTPTGQVERHKVQIKKGQSSAAVKLVLSGAGLNDVWATNHNLVTGQNVVNVVARPPGHVKQRTGIAPQEESKYPRVERAPASLPEVLRDTNLGPHHIENLDLRAELSIAKELSHEAKPVAKQITKSKIKIALRITPDRKLLAGGIDTAVVHAFLTAPAPTLANEVKVHLWSSGDENPSPKTIVIPAGHNEGTATLRSAHVGVVTIGVAYVEPDALVDPKEVHATFGPPITGIKVIASPPSIPLIGSSELDVQLVDPRGIMVKTDEPRDVVLLIERGSGEILPLSVSIGKGMDSNVAKFLPWEPGPITLEASTSELQPKEVHLNVNWPFLLLLLSLVGGALGGIVVAFKQPGRGKKPNLLARLGRFVAGLISGAILYLLVAAFVTQKLPWETHISVLNPFVAVLIPALGGYYGPSFVFPLLKEAIFGRAG